MNVRKFAHSRGDDFPWSSSAGTSDRGEESEVGASARVNAMVRAGSALLTTELWSWGNISRGQLGTGDMIKRHRPTIVSRFSNAGVRSIACGQAHAMAITLDGRAYAWGGNNANQVGLRSAALALSFRRFSALVLGMDG